MYDLSHILEASRSLETLYNLWFTAIYSDDFMADTNSEQIIYGKHLKVPIRIDYLIYGTPYHKVKRGIRLFPKFALDDEAYYDAIVERKRIIISTLLNNIEDNNRTMTYTEKEELKQKMLQKIKKLNEVEE